MVAAFLRSSAASAIGERILRAGFLDKGELGGGGGGGDDDAAAGVFAVESGEGVAAEFRLDDVFDDFGFAEVGGVVRARGCSGGCAGGRLGTAPGDPGHAGRSSAGGCWAEDWRSQTERETGR